VLQYFGVAVKVKITDTLKGKQYCGPHKDGYKLIRSNQFVALLKNLKKGVKI